MLIDTAGRYTSQDSDQETDSAAWQGFLDLLRKHRGRQPLNGVLVALSVKDLLDGRGAGGIDHARAVRSRLAEIESRLGVRLPVYLVLTKADLIAGFSEFFAGLGERDRAQIWGVTLPGEPGRHGYDRGALESGLTDLIGRLDGFLHERLLAERDIERRALALGFPAQVQALIPDVLRLVDTAFGGSSFEETPWLRGVYLTSGTQTGTPVDRLVAAISQSFGMPTEALPVQAGDRSFFLQRLLGEVVFGEASLVARDPRRERNERWVRSGVITAMGVLVVAALAGWTWSYRESRDHQLALEQAMAGWARDYAPLAQDRLTVGDGALAPVVPALDRLAALRAEAATPDRLAQVMGLSRSATLAAETDVAYRKSLRDLLTPRLMIRLEQQIQAHIQSPDYLIEALKVYLMLGGQAPVDPDLLTGWFRLDLQANEPAIAAAMTPHLVALAAELPTLQPLPTLDGALLARARATLGKISLAQQAYRMLMASAAVTSLPPWRVTDHAGPSAATALVRRSGKPLDAPVPGIFTRSGFYGVLLPSLPQAAKAAYAESWVLAGTGQPQPTDADLSRLQSDMLKLYEDDDIDAWDGLLRDIAIVPMTSLDQAVDATKALSGPNSPLKLLVAAIVQETMLTQAPQPTTAAAAAGGVVAAGQQALGTVSAKLDKLAQLIGAKPAVAATGATPGAVVEQHFAYLKGLVEGVNGAPPALDAALQALASLHGKLAEAATSPDPAAAFARIGPTGAAQLAQAAQSLPAPLNAMLAGIAQKAQAISGSGIRTRLDAVWRADVLPFCRTAIGGRYPFAPGSRIDASLDDTARLFAPGGLIDGFVKNQLAPFVDTAQRPWRDLSGAGLSSGALAQLDRAEQIGAALFAGGAKPSASFTLTPLDLDGGSASVTLDVDGQQLHYAHGPAEPAAFVWPGPAGTNIVRLSFAPLDGSAPTSEVEQGAWGLFRLLQHSRLRQQGQPDLFEVTLSAGGHSARFRLRAGSVQNPFNSSLLAGFSCPEGL